jgi:tetrahydromethanopterin S-methyltransferase subunit H
VELYRFAKDQSVVNVAGVKIGGQPGEKPTALCGTTFYQGHRIVEDEDESIFDDLAAEVSDHPADAPLGGDG